MSEEPEDVDALMLRIFEAIESETGIIPQQDLDKLIAQQRKYRAALASGAKPKKESMPMKDLMNLLQIVPKADGPAGGGFNKRKL